MKNITILKVLTVAIMFGASAQQMDFRVSEGLAESQRLIEVAYKAGEGKSLRTTLRRLGLTGTFLFSLPVKWRKLVQRYLP